MGLPRGLEPRCAVQEASPFIFQRQQLVSHQQFEDVLTSCLAIDGVRQKLSGLEPTEVDVRSIRRMLCHQFKKSKQKMDADTACLFALRLALASSSLQDAVKEGQRLMEAEAALWAEMAREPWELETFRTTRPRAPVALPPPEPLPLLPALVPPSPLTPGMREKPFRSAAAAASAAITAQLGAAKPPTPMPAPSRTPTTVKVKKEMEKEAAKPKPKAPAEQGKGKGKGKGNGKAKLKPKSKPQAMPLPKPKAKAKTIVIKVVRPKKKPARAAGAVSKRPAAQAARRETRPLPPLPAPTKKAGDVGVVNKKGDKHSKGDKYSKAVADKLIEGFLLYDYSLPRSLRLRLAAVTGLAESAIRNWWSNTKKRHLTYAALENKPRTWLDFYLRFRHNVPYTAVPRNSKLAYELCLEDISDDDDADGEGGQQGAEGAGTEGKGAKAEAPPKQKKGGVKRKVGAVWWSPRKRSTPQAFPGQILGEQASRVIKQATKEEVEEPEG